MLLIKTTWLFDQGTYRTDRNRQDEWLNLSKIARNITLQDSRKLLVPAGSIWRQYPAPVRSRKPGGPFAWTVRPVGNPGMGGTQIYVKIGHKNDTH
jgi:hypothetical protein